MSNTKASPDSTTGVRITAKFMSMAFLLNATKPHMGVDGSDIVGAWNTPLVIPTAPGSHTVTAYFPYVMPRQAGKGSITVDVAQGQIVDVTYKAPWLVFLKGAMKIG